MLLYLHYNYENLDGCMFVNMYNIFETVQQISIKFGTNVTHKLIKLLFISRGQSHGQKLILSYWFLTFIYTYFKLNFVYLRKNVWSCNENIYCKDCVS